MLNEVRRGDTLPVDCVGAVAIVAAVGVVARGHDESKKYMKERRWADRHRRSDLYKFANRAFRTQTMAAHTWCGNCIVTSWARPQEGDTVTTVTPDQPCTTLSDRIQRVYRPFHCMYLHFPIASIFFVSPPISERFVWSIFPYNYLICFRLRSRLLSVPVPLYLLIRYASGNWPRTSLSLLIALCKLRWSSACPTPRASPRTFYNSI